MNYGVVPAFRLFKIAPLGLQQLVCSIAQHRPVPMEDTATQTCSRITGVFHAMPSPRMIPTARSAKTKSPLDSLLRNVVTGKRLLKFRSGARVFSQGEPGAAIFFIKSGHVQLTVVSPHGKEAVLARLGLRDFMGEECLVGSSRRTSTATTMEASTIFRIEKRAMLRALHLDPRVSQEFISSLLARNMNLEEDLTDQLFNHSERRLACALLKLTRRRPHDKSPDTKLPTMTRKVLAEMVGTTVAKVGDFMKKFRTLGLIDYKGAGIITVKAERLTEAVLHD